MDEIERKTMQDIKNYVKSLDTPKNEVYQQNSLLIMSCFLKAIEFIEQNAKLRQPPVMLSLPDDEEIEKKAHEWLKANYGKYKPSEWRAFIESATWMRELSKCNGA